MIAFSLSLMVSDRIGAKRGNLVAVLDQTCSVARHGLAQGFLIVPHKGVGQAFGQWAVHDDNLDPLRHKPGDRFFEIVGGQGADDQGGNGSFPGTASRVNCCPGALALLGAFTTSSTFRALPSSSAPFCTAAKMRSRSFRRTPIRGAAGQRHRRNLVTEAAQARRNTVPLAPPQASPQIHTATLRRFGAGRAFAFSAFLSATGDECSASVRCTRSRSWSGLNGLAR